MIIYDDNLLSILSCDLFSLSLPCDRDVIGPLGWHPFLLYIPLCGFLPSCFSLVAFRWCRIPHNHLCGFGLTCLLLITWLCSLRSFSRLCLKAPLSSRRGNPTNMILGCGIRVWPPFNAHGLWLTKEVYGAIQVLPGSSQSTQLWSFCQNIFFWILVDIV